MDKRTTNTLAKFCIDQNSTFDSRDWLGLDDIDEKAVALAARYLSMTSWYGHEDDLLQIAERIHAFVDEQASESLHRESHALEFDLSYFSTLVRVGIARAHGRYEGSGAHTH